jgi:hypothetical protein
LTDPGNLAIYCRRLDVEPSPMNTRKVRSMGLKSRQKRSETRARRYIRDYERAHPAYQLPPDLEARINRRTSEIIRERRIIPNPVQPVEAVADRLSLMDRHLGEAREAFHKGVKLGQSRPVVAVLDLRDNLAGRIYGEVDPDHLRRMRDDAARQGAIPVAVVCMSRRSAVALIGDTCPATTALIEDMDPPGLFPILTIAGGGTRSAYLSIEPEEIGLDVVNTLPGRPTG